MKRILAIPLLLVALFNTEFTDTVSCAVRGDVYRMSERDGVEFAREDHCEGVRYRTDGETLLLWSPYIWVRVIVPAEYGHRIFHYRWGSTLAHVGVDTIPVEWGFVEKG